MDVEGAVLPSLSLEFGANYINTLPPSHPIVTSTRQRVKYQIND